MFFKFVIEKECYNCKHVELASAPNTTAGSQKLVKMDDMCDEWSESSN